MVEKGEYCKRTNANGVDLNRNWGFHHGEKISLQEETPGKKAFSEIETQFIRDSVKSMIDPLMFLSIHSGTLGLFYPYAFEAANKNKSMYNYTNFQLDSPEEVKRKKLMDGILQLVKKNHCSNCFVGTPFKLLNYESSGTCLDYIYDNLKVPFSFVWEVYSRQKLFPEMKKYEETHSKKNIFLELDAENKVTETDTNSHSFEPPDVRIY